MKLPLKTVIPLEVLDSPVDVYLGLAEREKNALRKSGITRTWHLLLYSARYMRVLEGVGKTLYPRIVEKMRAKDLPIHGLAECSVFWLQHICLSDGTDGERVRLFQAVTAEAGGRLWEQNFDTVEAFRVQHGVRRFMKIGQLFTNAPQEHPPLTAEQIVFLRTDALKAFGLTCSSPMTGVDNVFDASFLHEIGCDHGSVWDVLVILMHLRYDDFGGSPQRLRKRIEDVMGPLPLTVTSEELERIISLD